jgi:hypothetical protein
VNPHVAAGSAAFQVRISLTLQGEMLIVRHAAERRLLIFLEPGKVKL